MANRSKYGYVPNPWVDNHTAKELIRLYDMYYDAVVELKDQIEELKKRIELPLFDITK